MSDAEDGAFGGVGERFDFPAVSQNDLLDHCQAQTGAGLLGGEVGFEDFGSERQELDTIGEILVPLGAAAQAEHRNQHQPEPPGLLANLTNSQ